MGCTSANMWYNLYHAKGYSDPPNFWACGGIYDPLTPLNIVIWLGINVFKYLWKLFCSYGGTGVHNGVMMSSYVPGMSLMRFTFMKEDHLVFWEFCVLCNFVSTILGSTIARKLKQEGLACFALSPGRPPYHVAVYTPGRKVHLIIHLSIHKQYYDFMMVHKPRVTIVNDGYHSRNA